MLLPSCGPEKWSCICLAWGSLKIFYWLIFWEQLACKSCILNLLSSFIFQNMFISVMSSLDNIPLIFYINSINYNSCCSFAIKSNRWYTKLFFLQHKASTQLTGKCVFSLKSGFHKKHFLEVTFITSWWALDEINYFFITYTLDFATACKFGLFVEINLIVMVPESLKEKGVAMRMHVPILFILYSQAQILAQSPDQY